MGHFLMADHRTEPSRRTTDASIRQWFGQVLVMTVFICLGFTSDGLAFTTNKTALTFSAVQGGPNPSSQTISVSTGTSTVATLTTSDNASWLFVSPTTTYISSTALLTVIVNTSGLGAGTYNANITIKVGTWGSKVIPVTLTLSPQTTSPPTTTKSATLKWNAVTTSTVSGYRIYVGETSKLYTRTITVGPVTSSTVNSLTVGKTYYFAVKAYNSAGESGFSNEVSKTIQ